MLRLPLVLGMITVLRLLKLVSHRLTRADPIRNPPDLPRVELPRIDIGVGPTAANIAIGVLSAVMNLSAPAVRSFFWASSVILVGAGRLGRRGW